jgi:hypothetical protein
MKISRVIAKCLIVALLLVGMMAARADANSSVYLIGYGDASENTLVNNALSSHGFSVTIGDPFYSFTGSSSLSSYNAVLVMPAFGGSGLDMPTAGQTALLNYVNGGGGLVTTEWVIWLAGTGRLTTLEAALPASSGGVYDYWGSAAYTKNVLDPIIDFNLPLSSYSFSLYSHGGTESQLTAKGGATVFFDSTYAGLGVYGGLVGWGVGSGRVISFSVLAAQNDADFQQLLANSLQWSTNVTAPIPGSILLLGSGLVGLAAMRKRFIK